MNAPLSQKKCRVCDIQLNVHQAVRGICGSPDCLKGDIGHQSARRNQSIADNIRQSVSAPDSIQVRVLPYNNRKLARADRNRREIFVMYLSGIILAAKARRAADLPLTEETSSPHNGVEEDEQSLPVIGNGCALCGGRCCNTGGVTAWLEVATLERILYNDAELSRLSPEALTEYFVKLLPDEVHQDSCVYHGALGCELPRALRSFVCNNFVCPELATLTNALEDDAHEVLAGAVSATTVKRLAFLTRQTIRGRQSFDTGRGVV